jgi:ketosteroid isomerase-like protein
MKRAIVFSLLFLLGTGIVGCPQRAAETRQDIINETYPDEQAKIEKVIREAFDAAQKKEFDRLDAFHLYGPKFTKFDDWEPLTRLNAETAQKAERDAFTAISEFDYSINDFKADVFGAVAIATFTIDYSMKMGEEAASAKARSSMVFVKDGDHWRITHEHFSPFKSNP